MREKEIEETRKVLEQNKDDKNDIKDQADKVTKEIEEVNQEMSKFFEQKNELKDEYFKRKFDYEVQRDEMNHIQWMMDKKETILNREKDRADAIEIKQQQIKNLPHPFQKEIDTCSHLIAYCKNLKKKAGLEIDADE